MYIVVATREFHDLYYRVNHGQSTSPVMIKNKSEASEFENYQMAKNVRDMLEITWLAENPVAELIRVKYWIDDLDDPLYERMIKTMANI